MISKPCLWILFEIFDVKRVMYGIYSNVKKKKVEIWSENLKYDFVLVLLDETGWFIQKT